MDHLAAILGFALVTTFTPGPNNAMLMISGANWGFWRTAPHMLGIAVGFPVMLLAVAVGLGGLLETYPLVQTVLKYGAFAYLLYIAWKIARSGRSDGQGDRSGRPMHFIEAALFQWVNPKAWMIAIGAAALYIPAGSPVLLSAVLIAGAFAAVSLPCLSVWCLFGTGISRFLGSDRRIAWFNGTMAVLLVLSMVPTLF